MKRKCSTCLYSGRCEQLENDYALTCWTPTGDNIGRDDDAADLDRKQRIEERDK